MVEFDAERFREAVLYIAWRTKDDEEFGRVKLAKTLFYADFESYAEEGAPVTGARYKHWKYGPFPPALYHLVRELKRTGEAEVIGGESEGEAARLIPTHEPETRHLSLQQRMLLDLQIEKIARLPSWRVSDLSHEHPGWQLTQDDEEIPYAAAFVPTRPSPTAMEIARRRFGIDAS